MNDRELAAYLGHADVTVEEVFLGRWRVLCSCRPSKFQYVHYRSYSGAVESAIHHVTRTAQRFRLESERAGLSVTDALLLWNGRRSRS